MTEIVFITCRGNGSLTIHVDGLERPFTRQSVDIIQSRPLALTIIVP